MKKKQTKTGPKSVTGFSILKIYLQEKQQKEDWILNRKRRNRAGFFLGILLLLFGSMPAAAARQESEPNQLFATAACLMDVCSLENAKRIRWRWRARPKL